MNAIVRLGGWAVLALVLLWVILELVAIVFGFLTWVISTVLSLALLAVVLYALYFVVSSISS